MRSLPLKNGAINREIIQGVLPEKAVLPEAD
ncbi:MAG: hypothetical protein ACI9D0_001063 [Bacteroidia bacterium]|jgi:hypothetical protein